MTLSATSLLPELIEKVFEKIEENLKNSVSKNLSDAHILELHSLFGDTLNKAFFTLDTSSIILYKPLNKVRELIEVIGRNGKVYKLFPDVNYCPCLAFRLQVLRNQTQYTCKHVLAAKLARILGKIEIQSLPSDQFNFLIEQLLLHQETLIP